jgi:hypothetical protein
MGRRGWDKTKCNDRQVVEMDGYEYSCDRPKGHEGPHECDLPPDFLGIRVTARWEQDPPPKMPVSPIPTATAALTRKPCTAMARNPQANESGYVCCQMFSGHGGMHHWSGHNRRAEPVHVYWQAKEPPANPLEDLRKQVEALHKSIEVLRLEVGGTIGRLPLMTFEGSIGGRFVEVKP